MDPNNIQRRARKELKTVSVTIRISPKVSTWLREKNYSPSAIFNEALKELKCPHVE